jgi:cob(I)alamin adenosyltransferase
MTPGEEIDRWRYATLASLREHAPELHAAVLAGRVSLANADHYWRTSYRRVEFHGVRIELGERVAVEAVT